ncbi:MAG TPA: polysaccharide deacetylase family protein [Verrucomicrobiales bacterium]|nr:polysaccharide deacetylase family protein [Verrucomicrobiales bacterium]
MKFAVICRAVVFAFASVSCVKKSARTGTAASSLARPLKTQPASQTTGRAPAGAKISYTSVPAQGQFIAMTFDDGPVPANTPRLLDMLKSRGIRATFFVVGRNAQAYPNIIRRIIADGHEIANHTWTHPWLSKMSDAGVRSELQRSHDALFSLTGIAPRMYRPPYGAISARQKQWIMSEFGYPTILWSVDPEDWRTRSASMTHNRIVSQTRPGAIILVHDIHASSIDAMPSTLDDLLAKGFRFVTVSQLIGMSQNRGPATTPTVASVQGPTFTPGSF